jgi:hypothetical protein
MGKETDDECIARCRGDCEGRSGRVPPTGRRGPRGRDQHREALETVRQERERLRVDAETSRAAREDARTDAEHARTAGEEARVAAEAARQAVVEEVRATADTLSTSLDQMKVVEEMRRTLRAIQDVTKLGSN